MAVSKKKKVATKVKGKTKPKVQAKAQVKAKPTAKKPQAKMKAAAKKAAPPKSAQKKTPPKKTAQKASVKTAAPVKAISSKSKSLNYSQVFSPLDDRILVDAIPAETKTSGGLFIPDMAQEKQSRGIVVAVGPGKRNKKAKLRPLDVQMGDQIIYAKYAGTSIEVLGKEVLILREDEVLGILNK